MLFDLICAKDFEFIIEASLFSRQPCAFLFNLFPRYVQLYQPRLRQLESFDLRLAFAFKRRNARFQSCGLFGVLLKFCLRGFL